MTTEKDPYHSGAISLTATGTEENIKSIYHTPDKKSFRVGDQNLYLPVDIGAYEEDTPIDHDNFTDYEVMSVNLISYKRIIIGLASAGSLAGSGIVIGGGLAGIFIAIGIIVLLATLTFGMKNVYQSSTAAAVTLHMNHHSASFILQAPRREIKQLDKLLNKLIIEDDNTTAAPFGMEDSSRETSNASAYHQTGTNQSDSEAEDGQQSRSFQNNGHDM